MERVKAGEVDVMIGPRSALFTPFDNLGLIVIDEEHEGTYKERAGAKVSCQGDGDQSGPEWKGQAWCLGSATPSLEAFVAGAGQGQYRLLQLDRTGRGSRSLPRVLCDGYAGRTAERKPFHLKQASGGDDKGAGWSEGSRPCCS